MLFLIFRLDDDRYALAASEVAEVLPMVRLKRFPKAPPAVAGALDYHGAPVPVVDLCALMLGRAARPWASTRILVVTLPDAAGAPRLLGLLAERATETVRLDPEAFTP